jgi:hypothetical protein
MVMKTMNRMQMQECCCCCMMAKSMKGEIYIIGVNNKVKKKHYEKNSFNNSSFIEYQHQQRLG